MPQYAFEDFRVGDALEPVGLTVDGEELLAFAREFHCFGASPPCDDPAESAAALGGAPGWFMVSLLVRSRADSLYSKSTIRGGVGMSKMHWLRPVRAGDRLTCFMAVRAARRSRSMADIGLVTMEGSVVNGNGDLISTSVNTVMFGVRGAAAIPRSVEPPAGAAPRPVPAAATPFVLPFMEDLIPGRSWSLGSRTFDAAAIKAYARRYDPEPFHTDEDAAKKSFFGGLCASGIQTALTWSGLSSRFHNAAREQALREGVTRLPKVALHAGFRHLRWFKPVYAGDTVTYRAGIVRRRRCPRQPGWGIVTLRATGENQYGETVLEFFPTVVLEARGDKGVTQGKSPR
ncbi:MAG: MaoC family dehydratase N-terminal domain-containing protein [Methylobacteriaceae bacterium]|jgi:acyl dehydratase|nr:MaoC family dehydratase N-terminal domain-containing protein [Methylobacteriaceae bacterium]